MKQNKISIWYDQEGDYLEITLKKSKETYFDERKKDFAEIKDTKTQKIVGYAICNFLKKKNKELTISLPKI